MTEYDTNHDIWVEILATGVFKPTATLHVAQYPDGSPQNTLSASDLRDVAETLQEAADELEKHENEYNEN